MSRASKSGPLRRVSVSCPPAEVSDRRVHISPVRGGSRPSSNGGKRSITLPGVEPRHQSEPRTTSRRSLAIGELEDNSPVRRFRRARQNPWVDPMLFWSPLRRVGARVLATPQFEICVVTVIALNMVTMGIESHMPHISRRVFLDIEWAFLLIYTTEFLLRSYVHRTQVFKMQGCLLDLVVVIVAWLACTAETWRFDVLLADTPGLRSLNSLKVLRALRAMRFLRMFAFSKDIWLITSSFFSCLKPLFWTTTFLLVILFSFSQFAIELIGTSEYFEEIPEARLGFSTTVRAMVNLFQISTFDEWRAIAQPICDHHGWAYLFFACFIAVTGLALMNLITAVVVETSIEKTYKDEAYIARGKSEQAAKEKVRAQQFLRFLDEDVEDMEISVRAKREKARIFALSLDLAKKPKQKQHQQHQGLSATPTASAACSFELGPRPDCSFGLGSAKLCEEAGSQAVGDSPWAERRMGRGSLTGETIWSDSSGTPLIPPARRRVRASTFESNRSNYSEMSSQASESSAGWAREVSNGTLEAGTSGIGGNWVRACSSDSPLTSRSQLSSKALCVRTISGDSSVKSATGLLGSLRPSSSWRAPRWSSKRISSTIKKIATSIPVTQSRRTVCSSVCSEQFLQRKKQWKSFERILDSLGISDSKDVELMMAMFDANEDGVITMMEFLDGFLDLRTITQDKYLVAMLQSCKTRDDRFQMINRFICRKRTKDDILGCLDRLEALLLEARAERDRQQWLMGSVGVGHWSTQSSVSEPGDFLRQLGSASSRPDLLLREPPSTGSDRFMVARRSIDEEVEEEPQPQTEHEHNPAFGDVCSPPAPPPAPPSPSLLLREHLASLRQEICRQREGIASQHVALERLWRGVSQLQVQLRAPGATSCRSSARMRLDDKLARSISSGAFDANIGGEPVLPFSSQTPLPHRLCHPSATGSSSASDSATGCSSAADTDSVADGALDNSFSLPGFVGSQEQPQPHPPPVPAEPGAASSSRPSGGQRSKRRSVSLMKTAEGSAIRLGQRRVSERDYVSSGSKEGDKARSCSDYVSNGSREGDKELSSAESSALEPAEDTDALPEVPRTTTPSGRRTVWFASSAPQCEPCTASPSLAVASEDSHFAPPAASSLVSSIGSRIASGIGGFSVPKSGVPTNRRRQQPIR